MPEHNLIQRPEIMLRLQQWLGVRQAHITPTLSEHLQAVVIVGDVRESPDERTYIRPVQSVIVGSPTIGQFYNARLRNPASSGVNIRVTEVRCYSLTSAAGNRFGLELGVFPDGASAFGLSDFRRDRVAGYLDRTHRQPHVGRTDSDR